MVHRQEKKEADRAYFEKVVSKSLKIKIKTTDITDVIRLGSSNGRTRPLRVTMSNMEIKRVILKEAKHLCKTEDKNIFICPDLTFKQRENDAMLRKTLKERKEAGERNLYIQKGQIMERKPPQPTSQKANTNVPTGPTTELSTNKESIYSDIDSENEINPFVNLDSTIPTSDVENTDDNSDGDNNGPKSVDIPQNDLSNISLISDTTEDALTMDFVPEHSTGLQLPVVLEVPEEDHASEPIYTPKTDEKSSIQQSNNSTNDVATQDIIIETAPVENDHNDSTNTVEFNDVDTQDIITEAAPVENGHNASANTVEHNNK